MGKRPYNGKSRREIRDQILSRQVQIKNRDLPKGYSLEAMDFVNRLIQRKPRYRLGLDGPQQVMEHVWFKDVDWEALKDKELESPFKPYVSFVKWVHYICFRRLEVQKT